MSKSKIMLCTAIGLAALGLALSRNARVREEIAQNVKKLKKKVKKLSGEAEDELESLKDMVSSKIEGLSDEAREAIMEIISKSTADLKKNKSVNAIAHMHRNK